MLCHLLLGDVDLIGDAVVPDDIMYAVVDSVARPWIAVTGLPHAAGVDDEPILLKPQRCIQRDFAEETVPAAGKLLKGQWYMAMSNQAKPSLKIVEADLGAKCGKQVLPDRLTRAAMSQGKITLMEGKR